MANLYELTWTNSPAFDTLDSQQVEGAVGEDQAWEFSLDDGTVNVSAWGIQFDVAPSDNRNPVLTVASGSITKGATGDISFSTLKAVTEVLPPRNYYWELLRTDAGSRKVLAFGNWTLTGSPSLFPGVVIPSTIIPTNKGGTGTDLSATGPGVIIQATAGANLTSLTGDLASTTLFLRKDLTWQTPAGSGVGTVTSVSVVTANGVSGTVATDTTTPAITITLGAITPSSVNGITITGASSPTLLVTGPTSISGTNTGDQTNISGNAATVSVVDSAADTTTWPMLATAQTGNLSPATDSGITYDAATNTLTLGVAGASLGNLVLSGSTSGYVQINAAAAAGSWTLTLPANNGDSGQFLQTDGNGVTSWQTAGGVPTTITVANEAADTSCFVGFFTAATGDLGPKSNAGLTFNSSTAILTATGFAGPLTGNVTGDVSGSSGSCTGNAATATLASTVTVADEAADTSCFLTFVTAATGSLGVKSNAGAAFNSSTGVITATGFAGPLTGNVTGNVSGSAGSVAVGGITGLGTNVATALAVNVGSAGAFITFNGALGTPSSGTATNLTGLPLTTGVTGTLGAANGGTGVANNAASTITISGNFATTLTVTGTTGVTLPTTGTLATLAGAETLSGKTLTAPKFADLGFIADANGNELVIFTTTASAVNEITVANGATGVGPTFTASGETNVDINFQVKGSGVYNLKATASGPTTVNLFEDTDNGTSKVSLKAPSALGGDVNFQLPNSNGTSGYTLQTDGSGNTSWASSSSGSLVLDTTISNLATSGMTTTVYNRDVSISFGTVVRINVGDGSGIKNPVVKASAAAGNEGLLPLYMVLGTIGSDVSGTALAYGLVRNDSWSWQIGDAIYLSASTAGLLTSTAPSGSGELIRFMGVAVFTNMILFNPSSSYSVVP